MISQRVLVGGWLWTTRNASPLTVVRATRCGSDSCAGSLTTDAMPGTRCSSASMSPPLPATAPPPHATIRPGRPSRMYAPSGVLSATVGSGCLPLLTSEPLNHALEDRLTRVMRTSRGDTLYLRQSRLSVMKGFRRMNSRQRVSQVL